MRPEYSGSRNQAADIAENAGPCLTMARISAPFGEDGRQGALDAIILAGGKGTRLAPVLGHVPKPLAPVGGKPFLDHLFAFLASTGVVSRVVLSIGHLGNQIEAHYGRHPPTLPLSFSAEHTPLGTGGAVLLARKQVKGNHFLVLNGDSIVGVDLHHMVVRHLQSGADASVALVSVSDAGRYGYVKLDGKRIVGFHEKKSGSGPGLINAGLYIFRSSSLAPFPIIECSLEHDILPKLLQGTVRGEVTPGPFIDIGLPESYDKAQYVVSQFRF